MAARVAVDAEHGRMSRPAMAPPERHAGPVDRQRGLGEDRHEGALVSQADEIAVHESPDPALLDAKRSRRREERAGFVDESGVGVELARAGQSLAQARPRGRLEWLPAEVALEDEAVQPGPRPEQERLEAGDGGQSRAHGGHGLRDLRL